MRIAEVKLPCRCTKGHMYMSTLQDDSTGKAVMFVLTEDEQICFQGLCTYCGREFEACITLMELLFSCPTDKEEH